MAVLRMHFLVSGKVQGVGFRFHTRNKAAFRGLSGWVRNCPDGQVEIEAQGEAHSIALFTEDLRRGPRFAQVAGMASREIPIVNEGREFILRW